MNIEDLSIFNDLRLKLRAEVKRNLFLTAEVDILHNEAKWSFRWGAVFGMVAGVLVAFLTIGLMERLQ